MHAAQASHSTIDRQIDSQFTWIIDAERILESVENEAYRLGPNPPRESPALKNILQRLKVRRGNCFTPFCSVFLLSQKCYRKPMSHSASTLAMK